MGKNFCRRIFLVIATHIRCQEQLAKGTFHREEEEEEKQVFRFFSIQIEYQMILSTRNSVHISGVTK